MKAKPERLLFFVGCAKKCFRLTSLLVCGLFFCLSVFAQQQMNCNCLQLLQESMHKVSTIYAGFGDKVNAQTRPRYNDKVKQLEQLAGSIKTERKCYELLKQYTDWFEDRHVGIWFGLQTSPATLRRIPLHQISDGLNLAKDSLEGIWSTSDHRDQYAIMKDPLRMNKFIAVVLKTTDSNWQPGMIKTEFYGYDSRDNLYRGMYYQASFSGVLDGFTLKANKLDHWFGPSWYRLDTSNATDRTTIEDVGNVRFDLLDKDFVYVKLGRFNQEDVNKLDSLLQENRTTIQTTRNLILDLRGNPGGNASSSQEMIQLIYTNPIIYPPWQYMSSPELIDAKKKEVFELQKDDPYNRLTAQELLLRRLLDHPGQLVSSGDSIVRTVKSPYRYPERVAFLIDGRAGSSAEFFTFEGKQSKKVTLFGSNTAGVMDYGEAQSFSLSCGQFVLSVPWGRNGWIERLGFRIDNIGFAPDVVIPGEETDWVRFVMKYWSR